MNSAVYTSLPGSACTLSTEGSGGPDRISRLSYDAAGQITLEQRAYGLVGQQQNYATYAYTLNGRQDWVQDANGNRTDFTYDGFDRMSRIDFPSTIVGAHSANSGDSEVYGYDKNSNRTSVQLRTGQTILYHFDALNRVYRKQFPSGSSNSDVYFGYDLQGHELFARFGSISGYGVTNVFDGFGQQSSSTSTTSAGSLQLSYLYDANGNRTRITWPDSNYVGYLYDDLDRMVMVGENAAAPRGAGLLP